MQTAQVPQKTAGRQHPVIPGRNRYKKANRMGWTTAHPFLLDVRTEVIPCHSAGFDISFLKTKKCKGRSDEKQDTYPV